MTDDDGVYISDVYKPPKPDPVQHHNQQRQEQQQQQQQQQRVSKPSPAPKTPQWIPTKEWVSSFKARIADPIELPPPPPLTPRPLSSFDTHVKATLRRLNRYIDKSGPQLPPSDNSCESDNYNSCDSDNSNGSPRIKYKNRFIQGPNYDMAQSERGIKSSFPPHLQPLKRPQPQPQPQTDTTELPDADVEAAHTEMSGPDEDLNNYIYSLRKESCERLASAWQSIFDRFGNSDIDEEASEVDFAVEDYIPKSKENYGRRKRHKLRVDAKPRKPEGNVFVAQDSDTEEDIYSSGEEGEEEDEDEGEEEEFYEDYDEEKEEEVYESLGELETEEEDEEKFVKASTDRLGRFLKDEDEDEGEEPVRVWRKRIQHEQWDEGNTKDAAVVAISDSGNPPSPSRHRTRTHRSDRHRHNHYYHHHRPRQDQEEQDRSDRSHHIPEDRHHHHSDSSRLFNLFDSPYTDRRWKEENRVSGSDVDIQAKLEKRYSHSGRARHPAGEDEEAEAKGTVVRTDEYQTGPHRRDENDSVDTFNFRWDQPRYGPLPKPSTSDLMIMRRAFNKWRWYSASRHDYSARNRGDPKEVSGEEDVVVEREVVVNDEEAAYDGDESNTEVEQEYQCVQSRRQQHQQQQRQVKEEEFSPVASVMSPTATEGLTFESTAIYNRSGTLRLHMKPQTRALAAALSPRKRVSPTPLRLLNTASGLNPFAAGDSNWGLSDADGIRSSPPPFSDSPSPTGNLWSSDAFPDFSVAGSPMTTPRKRQTQQPLEFDLTTPKALRFMSIDDLYRLQDKEHESVPFSNPSRTADQQYTRLIIPASPLTFPTTTHRQDYGFFDTPSSLPPPTTAAALSSSVEALYNAATGSEFATSTFLPRQQPEGPPVPALVLDEVDEDLLREMNGLSTAMGTPRRSRAVVDPLEARLMTPKTKALASLLMSKKKISFSPSSRPAAGAQSPALVSDSVFGSGSVLTSSSTVTATPPISSSATTPNPSNSPSPPSPLSLPQPPLSSRSAAGAGAPLFQMHTGYPMGERGTKRQYGQDDDDDDDDDGDDDDGLESFKVVKSDSQYGIFHSPRPLS